MRTELPLIKLGRARPRVGMCNSFDGHLYGATACRVLSWIQRRKRARPWGGRALPGGLRPWFRAGITVILGSKWSFTLPHTSQKARRS